MSRRGMKVMFFDRYNFNKFGVPRVDNILRKLDKQIDIIVADLFREETRGEKIARRNKKAFKTIYCAMQKNAIMKDVVDVLVKDNGVDEWMK